MLSFYKHQLLLESNIVNNIIKYISLNEAVKLAKEIQSILDKYDIEIEPDTRYKEVDIIDDKLVNAISNDNKNIQMKISKLISEITNLDPTGSEYNKVYNEILQNIKLNQSDSKNFEIKIYKDVSKYYCVAHSCMVKSSDITRVYDIEPNIYIAVQYIDNKPVGRALLWKNTTDENDNINPPFVDRTYPADDENVRNNFITFAKQNNYLYRKSNNVSNKTVSDDNFIYYKFETDVKELNRMPYIDTFTYGRIVNNTLFVQNHNEPFEMFEFDDERGTAIYYDTYFEDLLDSIGNVDYNMINVTKEPDVIDVTEFERKYDIDTNLDGNLTVKIYESFANFLNYNKGRIDKLFINSMLDNTRKITGIQSLTNFINTYLIEEVSVNILYEMDWNFKIVSDNPLLVTYDDKIYNTFHNSNDVVYLILDYLTTDDDGDLAATNNPFVFFETREDALNYYLSNEKNVLKTLYNRKVLF